jgi:pimeloyl-ACP methyl ester carboxylesterase
MPLFVTNITISEKKFTISVESVGKGPIPILVSGHAIIYGELLKRAFGDSDLLKNYCFYIPRTYWCEDEPLSQLPEDVQTQLTLSDLVHHLEEIRLSLWQHQLLSATQGKIGIYAHSLFSAIAFHYAATYPDSLLFIEAEGPCPYTTEEWAKEKSLFFTANASLERQNALAQEGIPPSGSTVDEKSLGSFPLFRDAYQRMSPTIWYDFKKDNRGVWGNNRLNMVLYKHVFTNLFRDYDCRSLIDKVQCPVHFSLGIVDTPVPFYLWIDPPKANGIGFFNRNNRDYHVFERSGHWPATEEPAVYCSRFDEFINQQVVPHLLPSTRDQIEFEEKEQPRSRL